MAFTAVRFSNARNVANMAEFLEEFSRCARELSFVLLLSSYQFRALV
jgi:hypothetical protein